MRLQPQRDKPQVLSPSLPILNQIPKVYGLGCFPIVLFHKSACTNNLVDFVETQILQGVSFLKICEGIASFNFKEFKECMRCYSLSQASQLPGYLENCDRFYSDSVHSVPGNN